MVTAGEESRVRLVVLDTINVGSPAGKKVFYISDFLQQRASHGIFPILEEFFFLTSAWAVLMACMQDNDRQETE